MKLLLCVVVLVGAAPVPKQAPPLKLTQELLKGTWHYEWSTMLGGWITFDGKGNYTAQHDPNSTTTYSGTAAVGDGTIMITEWSFDSKTGNSYGPTCYRFDVDMKNWPNLPGKSTGGFGFDVQAIPQATLHLKLSNRR